MYMIKHILYYNISNIKYIYLYIFIYIYCYIRKYDLYI